MAISTLAINANNDLYLVDGSNFGVLTGIDAVVQDVGQATRKVRGENQFNINEGVDYFGAVFSPVPDYDAFRAQLIDAALSVPDTIDVVSVTMARAGDAINYQMEITTIYGTTTVSGAIGNTNA